jgi:hypothetical protein
MSRHQDQTYARPISTTLNEQMSMQQLKRKSARKSIVSPTHNLLTELITELPPLSSVFQPDPSNISGIIGDQENTPDIMEGFPSLPSNSAIANTVTANDPTSSTNHVAPTINPIAPVPTINPIAPAPTVNPIAPVPTINPIAPVPTVNPIAPTTTAYSIQVDTSIISPAFNTNNRSVRASSVFTDTLIIDETNALAAKYKLGKVIFIECQFSLS